MRRVTTFRSTTDRIYDGGSMRLNIIILTIVYIFIGPCILTYEFLNVTNEMQLLETLLLSLLYMFRALLAHHQELTKTARTVFVSS